MYAAAVFTRAIPAPMLNECGPHSGGATAEPLPLGPWHGTQVTAKSCRPRAVSPFNRLKGHTARGRQLFAVTCVPCHGPNGNGSAVAPPLWGPHSFNIGAGMARVNTAAAYIHQLMPRNKPGSLTPQQAYDVAAYVTTRPRPDFPGKERDWPYGDAPPDVVYPT